VAGVRTNVAAFKRERAARAGVEIIGGRHRRECAQNARPLKRGRGRCA